MALVSYSSSEDSDGEENARSLKISKPPSTAGKATFQKIVNRSNPQQIEVHLPGIPTNSTELLENGSQPPTKRIRLGTKSFGDFNSILPAPKRANGQGPSNSIGKGRLGRGASLKTGSNPGFSREVTEIAAPDSLISEAKENDLNVMAEKEVGQVDTGHSEIHEVSKEEAPKTSKPAMFKPLSVARKPKKNKTQPEHPEKGINYASHSGAQGKEKTNVQKAPLFFAGNEADSQAEQPLPEGQYRPMLYESSKQHGELRDKSSIAGDEIEGFDSVNGDHNTMEDEVSIKPPDPYAPSNSLDSIAADLKLSASDRRQLFGRNKTKASEVSIVNFDTDQEYAANEVLRQAGEQAQHNPVRSIAPGKHSLKQLVSAASHQKDALEEHFASGKRNKKEAGSRYGW